MKFKKINTYSLEKCYAVNLLYAGGTSHVIAASEKINACLMFDLEGNYEEKIWDGPGGTMSLVPIENKEGMFLASQLFYSPDNSKNSKIVLGIRSESGNWKIQTIAYMPHIHRFDILHRNGVKYLIACTIKTHSDFEEDWRTPGKIYVTEFPENPENYNENNLLQFTIIEEHFFKNHGYYRMDENGYEYAVISAGNGVYKFIPPVDKNAAWGVESLLFEPTSDAALIDLDKDGDLEMIAIAPFHGDFIRVCKLHNGIYKQIFDYKAEFAHAIWAGNIYGKPAVIIGHRRGKRDLLLMTYENGVNIQKIDENVGSANVLRYTKDGVEYLVSANREIDEIAFYKIEDE